MISIVYKSAKKLLICHSTLVFKRRASVRVGYPSFRHLRRNELSLTLSAAVPMPDHAGEACLKSPATLLYKYSFLVANIHYSVYKTRSCCVKASRAVDASTRLGATDNMVALSYLPDRLSDTLYILT